MYASDLTNRKRAQVVYSDISKQKALLASGSISRINYQKGGNDYAYMIELEQGCINNLCSTPGYVRVNASNVSYATDMNTGGATQVDLSLLNEIGYPIANTLDDGYIPIPMNGMQFYFFGSLQTQMFWSSNCAIVFRDPGLRIINIPGDTAYLNSVNVPLAYRVTTGPLPAILLGNIDRRLDALYINNSSTDNYAIITLFVFYENLSATISTPNTGQYRVRIIKELVGQGRQWIEVSVLVSPTTPGYIAGDLDTDSTITDSTKLSPYNITDGTAFINLCGSTFSRVGPAAGTSFFFESDSTGSNWVFRNNSYIPV